MDLLINLIIIVLLILIFSFQHFIHPTFSYTLTVNYIFSFYLNIFQDQNMFHKGVVFKFKMNDKCNFLLNSILYYITYLI